MGLLNMMAVMASMRWTSEMKVMEVRNQMAVLFVRMVCSSFVTASDIVCITTQYITVYF